MHPFRREANYPLQGEHRYFGTTADGRPYTPAGLLHAMALWFKQNPDRTVEAMSCYPTADGWSAMVLTQQDQTPATTKAGVAA